jgi:hypothetical protein
LVSLAPVVAWLEWNVSVEALTEALGMSQKIIESKPAAIAAPRSHCDCREPVLRVIDVAAAEGACRGWIRVAPLAPGRTRASWLKRDVRVHELAKTFVVGKEILTHVSVLRADNEMKHADPAVTE